MRQISLAALLLAVCQLASATCLQAATGERCRVMDPTGSPLNARTGPHGTVLGTLSNGVLVSIIEQTYDQRGRLWVYVADYKRGRIGGTKFVSLP
jgi:hypothetical protein